MTARGYTGLAPWLPRHRVRARPRWWVARGDGARVVSIEQLADAVPVPRGVTGLAAPCSLPSAFLAFLGIAETSRASSLAALDGYTTARLAAEARRFAKAQPRGRRHPSRAERESLCALDRTRLPLFQASLPLLRRHDVYPWTGDGSATCLVEVDVPAWCAAAGLPSSGLAGDDASAIRRRAAIVDGLELDPGDARDLAVSSLPALRAVVALAAASRPLPPADPACAAFLALP